MSDLPLLFSDAAAMIGHSDVMDVMVRRERIAGDAYGGLHGRRGPDVMNYVYMCSVRKGTCLSHMYIVICKP